MKKKKCPECGGKGWVKCITSEQSGFECSYECPICGGTGKMECPRCKGRGTVNDDD